MAETQSFGELKFKILSHDEVAQLMRWTLKWAQQTDASDPEIGLALKTVRSILPLMKADQIAMLLTAIPESGARPMFVTLRQVLVQMFDSVNL